MSPPRARAGLKRCSAAPAMRRARQNLGGRLGGLRAPRLPRDPHRPRSRSPPNAFTTPLRASGASAPIDLSPSPSPVRQRSPPHATSGQRTVQRTADSPPSAPIDLSPSPSPGPRPADSPADSGHRPKPDAPGPAASCSAGERTADSSALAAPALLPPLPFPPLRPGSIAGRPYASPSDPPRCHRGYCGCLPGTADRRKFCGRWWCHRCRRVVAAGPWAGNPLEPQFQ